MAARLADRQNTSCDHVATQDLEEICFPHSILLDEDKIGTRVRGIGNAIAKPIQRAMPSG